MTDRSQIHISLVSYLNSYPFHYGLLRSNYTSLFNLTIVPPSECAANFKTGKSNIALVPVGALPELESYQIIEPFCIAASGSVKSVFLQSNKTLKDISTISLDPASISSNLLTKILCKHAWGISPDFIHDENKADARVIIGDRALQNAHAYPLRFDLAEEWKKKYGLPFVFAVWIASKSVETNILNKLNMALDYGVNNIKKAIETFGSAEIDKSEAIDYLRNNIVFRLNNDAKEAISLFLRLAKITR